MTASPPADQPADHIGEANEMVDRAELKRLAEALRVSWSDRGWVASKKINGLLREARQAADAIDAALSLIARQQETIRADGEFAAAYDALRSTWSFRQACALHADDEKYRWACEKFDAAFDAADQARARLSAPQPKEPK